MVPTIQILWNAQTLKFTRNNQLIQRLIVSTFEFEPEELVFSIGTYITSHEIRHFATNNVENCFRTAQ